MRLIGILCWWDESPSWLAATVTSMIQHLQLDHLVAVDGAYLLVQNGTASSGVDQHQILAEVCRAGQCGLTLHVPREPWLGNEVEKRSYAFRLAEHAAESDRDWYVVMDADEVILSALGTRAVLENTEHDAGECWSFDVFDPFADGAEGRTARKVRLERRPLVAHRKFFRAVPGLHVAANHFTYVTGSGERLWGISPLPAAAQTGMEVEHRSRLRDRVRREQQTEYYRRRDEAHVEHTYTGPEFEVAA